MRRRVAIGLCLPVGAAALVMGLAEVRAVTRPPIPDVEVTTPEVTPKAAPEGRAGAAVHAVDAWAAGRVDGLMEVAVLDRRTGEFAKGGRADAPVYSASLAKLVVAIDVLDRRHVVPVDDQARAWIRQALGPSDDNAMNALWERFDGPGAVRRVAERLDLTATRPPDDLARWGETIVSAEDVVRVFEHVLTDLPPEDRDFVMAALRDAPDVAAGGFDQHYGLEELPSAEVKSAWMCCVRNQTNMHSAGVTDTSRRYVVALLSSQPVSGGYDGAKRRISEATDVLRAGLEE
ncbi:serine hydrolase [Saccharopolyspora erythraea]|uniref:Conserved alanine rich lipoprotein LppW n=2 Tax=Saccharopolyspora erythraea TaxID=1836 RepID=A4FAX5_SACEN|nr:serine hydrolase [Saccharopolyspora erythraea]EQD87635.1 hypothetical protein N599_03410 [Saccharopolyspora erythraea D]QRK91672.1 hypothetical protein JQX30_09990 [Saccharopolyspora erythraea]CAM01200.1 putative conserved alanine rich lipoprotein LppW [Saccharopolyspora erythraea NRRL 2338]